MLAEEFLRSVNAQIPGQIQTDVRIVDFFDHTYLPFIRDDKRASTVFSYEKLFDGKLRSHFGTRTLSEYQTSDGFKFLQSLKGLNRNSLQHVRSLASGIFSHAVNQGLLKTNPWREVRFKSKTQPEPTRAYTLAESLAILAALKASQTDAALIFACIAFLGMRPSEAAGLRWRIRLMTVSGSGAAS